MNKYQKLNNKYKELKKEYDQLINDMAKTTMQVAALQIYIEEKAT
jgi:hypothetical protein